MTKAHALLGARIGFVLLVVGSAWWGFDGRWSEIGDALAGTEPVRLTAALLCALAGLTLTGMLWRMLLSTLGSRVELRDAGAVFFVGQLGKYVPGLVWTFATQAQLGRRHGVAVRSSVTASALFLVLHTFTGLTLGGLLVAGGVVRTEVAAVWWLLLAAVGAAALTPGVLRLLGNRMAGADVRASFDGTDLARSVALMSVVWLCYGLCLWLLMPLARPEDLFAAAAAFALAHAAGVLLVLAPAGLGAREAVLIALLAPAVGVPSAAATALLARVVHTSADFLVAAGAAGWSRRARTREAVGVGNA